MPWRSSSGRLVLAVLVSMFAAIVATGLAASTASSLLSAQEPALQFGGAYSGLGARRQRLIDDWVARFNQVTGQNVDAGAFYDTFIKFSTKTTFDAVTHALMTTSLTDPSGASLGDALDLVERVDTVKGQVPGGSGDRQFRMYAIMEHGARGVLERSREFARGRDNTVYHKGYPLNFREQGGAPSIQISMALDGRHADIDVDYRSPSFPAAMFNGHLTAANSDVRMGDNFDRHSARWNGLQNWWRSFLGVRVSRAPADVVPDASFVLPVKPRAGARPIDAMVDDFLTAWLVEGDIIAAMGSVSERAYACLAADSDDPAAFDRGMAAAQLMTRMKVAYEALGRHGSLEGLTVGVRLGTPALNVVTQPHHAQYVIYAVPDDVAAQFDCARQLAPAAPVKAQRVYGTYYGSVFHIAGPVRGGTVALLWAKDKGYWKIVSWRTDIEEEDDKVPPAGAPPDAPIIRVKADAALVAAARGFLESWLVRKDADKAFPYLSPESYGCYNASRSAGAPAAASPADAGRLIRAALERGGGAAGNVRSLDTVVAAAEPVHAAVRLMEHTSSRTFTLVSYPDGLQDVAGCAVAASQFNADGPHVYGNVFGMNVRFVTGAGEGPVMRTVWVKTADGWRITAYYIEYP